MSDPQQPISVTTRWDERTAVIQLAGELDLHSAGELGTAIDEERLALSRQILDVVTDGHDLSQAAGSVSFRARKLVRGRGVG